MTSFGKISERFRKALKCGSRFGKSFSLGAVASLKTQLADVRLARQLAPGCADEPKDSPGLKSLWQLWLS